MVGDIVLTPFPFTDLSQIKIRPAVVVAYVGTEDWIVCAVSSSPGRDAWILITGEDLAEGVLRFDSWARPSRITTQNESLFRRTIGHLTAPKRDEILVAVRGLF